MDKDDCIEFLSTAKVGALAVLFFLVCACSSNPSAERLANADYGSELSTDECRTIAEETIANGMRDPSSARFRNSTCSKGVWDAVPLFSMRRAYGWVQEGEVNGRNVFGGTGGFRPYKVLIRNGSVVRYCIRERAGGYCVPLEI